MSTYKTYFYNVFCSKKNFKKRILKNFYTILNTRIKIQKESNTSFWHCNFFGFLFYFFLLLGINSYANNALANTNTLAFAPITNFPAGVYIIDMGQPVQTVNNGLKPYGLVYALINAGIPVNWAIEPTKAKDGIDFYATTAANGNKAYKGGSFIVDVVTYPAALPIITSWRTANAGLVVDGPTTAAFNAPIYKVLTIWPKAFLDADNDPLITPYYAKAGIPSSSYVLNSNPTFLPQCGSISGTQDVYILPHADPDTWSADWISALQNFIDNGGSMWAGCHGVSDMENLSGCNFLSVNGLVNYADPGHSDGSPAYTYLPSANGDPIMQFIGTVDTALQGGSEDIYVPGASGWRSTTVLATYDANYINTVPTPDVAYTYPNAATVIAYGHAFGDASKGYIMYEAGHSFNGTDPPSVASQRAFFNFLLLSGGLPQTNITPPNIANQITSTCGGVAFNFTPSGAAANVKYTWTAPTGSGFTGGSAQTIAKTSIIQTLTNTTSNPVTAVYTVTPRIGGCLGNPFTLTVTVYPAPTTITLTSGAGTNIVSTPIDVAMVNITYATTNATGVTFSGLPPGVTGTWASNIVTISGTPTEVGIYNYTVSVMGHNTCGGTSASGTITTYVCPTFSLLSTTTSSVNVCLGSSSLVSLTANPANLPVGNYLVSYEIQGVAQTPAVMIVTTAGTGSFVYTGFTTVGVRTITITNIASGLCSSLITTNNLDTVTVVATLAAPTALAGSGATCTQITANWQATVGTTYYELDVSTSNTFASFLPGFNALNVGLVTSYNVTGLTTGTTYYYRVRAFNGLCISGNSGTITYATTVLPGTVTSNNATNTTCNTFTANWTATANATSYLLDVSTVNTFATFVAGYNALDVGNVTSFVVNGLTSNTQYFYRLRAKNGCGVSTAYSTTKNTTTLSAVPGTISSLAATLISCDRFTANWTAVSVATSYLLDVSTSNTFAAGFFVGVYNGFDVGNVTSVTITGLNPNTTYYYRIKGKNGCGISANFSTVRILTTSNAVPGTVTATSATSISCDGFTANWTAVTAAPAATSYQLDVSTSNTFAAGSFVGVYNGFNVGNVTSVTLSGLASGTTYYYRIKGVNSCGASTSYSVTITVNIPSTPPGTVTSNAASQISCTYFTANWTLLAAATSYLLDVSTSNVFAAGSFVGGYNGFDVGNVSSLVLTGLNPNTIYYYRVKGKNGCGTSAAFSTIRNATTLSLPTTPTVSTSGSLTFCENDSVTLGSSITGTTYLWSTGETTQFIFVTTPGSYTVRVTNASGCQSATSLPATVVVQGLPTATAGGSQSICSNETATVSGATATNGTIAWTENGAGSITDGATTLSPTYTPAAGDIGNTVTLTMTVTSNNSCAPQTEVATYTVFVAEVPSPPTISTITQPTGCASATGSVLLTNLLVGGILNPGNITYVGTSYTVSGLNPGTHNFSVTNGSCSSPASANVIINPITIIDNVWDGTDWSTGCPPTSGNERIIFNASYTADIDLKGCSCLVNGTAAVTINSDKNLTLTNELTVAASASITFNNNASLVQINNSAINSGSIKMIRTSRPMRRWSYIYAGSPVVENAFGQIPSQFDLKYKWTSGTMNGSWVPLTALSSGEGFIARVRNIAPFNTGTGTINFEYTGTPKNGIVDVTVDSYDSSSMVAGNTALLANPYPSAIDGKKFLDYNVAGKSNAELGGTLFFWTSVTLYSGTGQYDVADYASWNLVGGVGSSPTTTPLDLSLKPNGKIAAGQGFFTQIFADGQIHFDNIMRESGFNNQFFRNSNTTQSDERNRIWLNLYSGTTFKQMLVGYVDGATDGEDRLYDGDSFTNNEINIYSLLNNRKLVIQGKALPFNENDEVPLGYKITNPGIYSIAIDELDGIFSGSQTIYLKDNLLNITHDLKASPYQFTSSAGTINDRFKIVYINNALGNPDYSLENNIKVIVNDEVAVSSSNLIMESIVVYNILGQKLISYKDINSNYFSLSGLRKNNTTLLLKIKLQSGESVVKKVIY